VLTQKDHSRLFAKGILQIVQELHISSMSSFPDLSDEELAKHVEYLEHRLNNWVASPARDGPDPAPYDKKVYSLVETVLAEFRRSDKYRQMA
jgi:hypothetical protein